MSLFQCKEKDGTLNVTVNGYVTKDPRIFEKDGKPVIASFSVCYGKKKYMDCKAWSGNEELFALAGCLEHHDVVSVSGVYTTHTGKDGKEYGQIDADFISVLQQPQESAAQFAPSDGAKSGGTPEGFTEIGEESEDDGQLPF